ncbi:MAG TPA: ABC transporter permease subunit [Deltaproteobacteria bacterium]|nr:ABC transporter permease subunit [Deltaproteobacteria bacterium]
MSDLQAQLILMPDALAGHLVISAIPLALAVVISVPLGLLAVDRAWLRGPLLAGVGLIQTIPGLALLALMVPLLVGLGDLLEPTGIEVPALGALPVLIALTLYGMLPVVRNTIVGIEGLAPGLLEAARAIGMTRGEILRMVELPLAAPVILAGVRTAAVWIVGMGTLATPVGQTSLGNYIFAGLQTRNVLSVLVGCVGAAGLALLVDGVLALVERAVRERERWLAIGACSALVLLVGGGIAGPRLARSGGGLVVRVGSKPFTEQYVLGRLIEAELQAAGIETRRMEGLGSAVITDALLGQEIDVYVEYTGTLWSNRLHREDTAEAREVQVQVCAWLQQQGGRCLGALGFENAYALAVRGDDAVAYGWASIADLTATAPELKIGGDYEFFQRPEWSAVRDTYKLRFGAERSYDPTFMYDAVAQGQVDVISAYTSDGRIAAFGLETLADPARALPPYDALLVLAPGTPAAVEAALAPLLGRIDVRWMREANRRVDIDGETPAEAAAWLQEQLRP